MPYEKDSESHTNVRQDENTAKEDCRCSRCFTVSLRPIHQKKNGDSQVPFELVHQEVAAAILARQIGDPLQGIQT